MYPTKQETTKKKETASTASFLDISLNFDKKKQWSTFCPTLWQKRRLEFLHDILFTSW